MHSRYGRTLADLPWHGTAVRLRVRTRRFFCDAPDCERRIFAERLDRTTACYARRTNRLGRALDIVGLALGGEAGARVARALRRLASPDTLLRRVRTLPGPAVEPVRVLSVDDWAWKKRHAYGTILTDLERGRVVDLLPDREAGTLARWLEAHPGVEVIARDRAGAYAEGASRGAPEAVQVADRWHLLRNLTDAVERTLLGRSALLAEAVRAAEPAPPDDPALVAAAAPPPTRAERAKADRRERRLARYREVVALRARGVPKRRVIAHELGLSVRTVRRWLAADGFPERKERVPMGSKLDPCRPYLEGRIREGATNATALFHELRARGSRGGLSTVSRAVRGLWPGAPAGPPCMKPPSIRRTAWLLVLPEEELTSAHRAYVAALAESASEIALVRALAAKFRRMLTERDARALGAWVDAARKSLLRSFARGLHMDAAALRAAITLPWSNGPTEGHVNRFNTVKRRIYGRAGLDLLRARVLPAA